MGRSIKGGYIGSDRKSSAGKQQLSICVWTKCIQLLLSLNSHHCKDQSPRPPSPSHIVSLTQPLYNLFTIRIHSVSYWHLSKNLLIWKCGCYINRILVKQSLPPKRQHHTSLSCSGLLRVLNSINLL